jgi:regulator of RNase E activity RraA
MTNPPGNDPGACEAGTNYTLISPTEMITNPMNQEPDMSHEHPLQTEARMMHLDKLIDQQEAIPAQPFSVPVDDLLRRYEQLYTGAINDVLRELCLLDQALPHCLVPLRDKDTVAGLAFTVKSAPNCLIRGEMDMRTRMLDQMHEDAFVVWDTSQDNEASLWGGVMTATAKARKVRAACIDGGIRDTRQILDQDFPVYYRYRTSNGSLGRCLITHYQVPIRIGRVMIRPGDLIFADLDGVLCVPRKLAVDVLLRAEEIKRNEKRIFCWVAEGVALDVITNKGGYF